MFYLSICKQIFDRGVILSQVETSNYSQGNYLIERLAIPREQVHISAYISAHLSLD